MINRALIFLFLFAATTRLSLADPLPARVVIIPLDSAPTILASILWRGDWQPGAAYAVGEAVAYEGSSYLCIQPHDAMPGNAPPAETTWHLLAAKGETGTPGLQGPAGIATAGSGISATGSPGNVTLSVDYANLVTPSGVRIESSASTVTIRANSGTITIAADGSIAIDTGAAISVNATGDIDVVGANVAVTASNSISFGVGTSSLSLSPTTLSLSAQQLAVSVDMDASVNVGKGLDVAAGGQMEIASTQSITADVGESSLAVSPAGITLDSPTVDIQGSASTNIASPNTRIDGGAVLDLNGGIIQLN